MGKVTVYCIVSGCTPEVASNLLYLRPYSGQVVTTAIESLADQHELSSQDDLCVIAPVYPSGHLPWQEGLLPNTLHPHAFDLHPEIDIRVVPHCVMGDSWDFGSVGGPSPNKQDLKYLVSYGNALMVQTYALDIMALATRGRMTPLRLWRLAMQQGFKDLERPDCLEGVEYGEITGRWEQIPDAFPGFTTQQLMKLDEIGDVEIVKQRLVHEGLFWVWMAPDRFPVSQANHEYHTPALHDVHPSASRSAIESLPSEVLIPIVSSLPLLSLLNLAGASRWLRTGILGNDYLACVWIYNNTPWWIPVLTQTPKKDDQRELQTTVPQAYLTSQWGTNFQLTAGFPAGLDWAYVMRCVKSGSMRNRERIWNTVLGIEHAADLAGV